MVILNFVRVYNRVLFDGKGIVCIFLLGNELYDMIEIFFLSKKSK